MSVGAGGKAAPVLGRLGVDRPLPRFTVTEQGDRGPQPRNGLVVLAVGVEWRRFGGGAPAPEAAAEGAGPYRRRAGAAPRPRGALIM